MPTIKRYERATYAMLNEAEEIGADAPKVCSVFAQLHGRAIEFLIVRSALSEVRHAIINEGGAFRAAFI